MNCGGRVTTWAPFDHFNALHARRARVTGQSPQRGTYQRQQGVATVRQLLALDASFAAVVVFPTPLTPTSSTTSASSLQVVCIVA